MSYHAPQGPTFDSGSPIRSPERYYHSDSQSLAGSTAYNGSEGYIDEAPPVDLDRDGYDDVSIVPPSKVLTPTRPAFGSRLLSSLSNAQPTAAGLTRSRSVLHSRAKSLASFVPKLNTSNSNTPEKSQQSNKIFGDLFNGESAPVRLGIPTSPTKEKDESEFIMEYRPTFTERPGGGPRRRTTAHSNTTTSTTTKTGWFGRRQTTQAPTATKAQDEILDIDINTSLFPHGPADPLSPHAFNDLLLNATNLLQRMQSAYKEKVDYIASIQPEIDAQKEEVEEAETRARHLKLQLEDMAQKAEEQNGLMQELAQQLAEEKLKVQEARDNARTIRPIRRSLDGDEEETPRRRKRGSAGSASDSGFESDVDRDNESVFSGADTPLSPPMLTVTPLFEERESQISSSKQRPAYSRLSSSASQSSNGGKRLGGEGAVWATMESLRSENKELKRQMEEMQSMLQGCIEFVGNVRL